MKQALSHTDKDYATVFHYFVTGVARKNVLMLPLLQFLLQKAKETSCQGLINSAKADGDTALHLAAEGASLDVVTTLCEFGAKVEAVNGNNETPIFVASKYNRADIVSFLVGQNKQSVDKRDANEWSPLLIAASFGHIETTDVLLKHGVELFTSDKDHQNVVHIATLEGHNNYLDHILKQCRSAAELVNERDIHHNTALHTAAEHGHLPCLKTLIQYKGKVRKIYNIF